MIVYALNHFSKASCDSFINTLKQFPSIERCIVWADNPDGVNEYIPRLKAETQCKEIILATSFFQGDCNHPASISAMLSEDEISKRQEIIGKCASHLDGLMLGNAGGELTVRAFVKDDSEVALYALNILRKCKAWTDEFNLTQWGGIMDEDIAKEACQYEDDLGKSKLLKFLRMNRIPNVIYCGYMLCYPVGDHRRKIVNGGVYSGNFDGPMGYPHKYFYDFVKAARMYSGVGFCYNILHGGLTRLSRCGFYGAVVGLNNRGLEKMDWNDLVERVNIEIESAK